MGSSGSGRFSDYTGVVGGKADNGGTSGGSSGNDKCLQAFSVILEDVGICEYFSKNKNVPDQMTRVKIILKTRIVAEDYNGLVVGLLPTSFNYLASCLEAGFNYVGVIRSSSNTPFPSIIVDFTAV